MIDKEFYRTPPEHLYHFTSINSLMSILSGGIGNEREIAFRVVSNAFKNDPDEIYMGETILNTCKSIDSEFTQYTCFSKFHSYKESGSLSFMEGEPNSHMLEEYGSYRLDFDLRNLQLDEVFWDLCNCEYVKRSEISQYASELAIDLEKRFNRLSLLKETPDNSSVELMLEVQSIIHFDIDILRKVFLIKEQKWQSESEWRIIREIKPADCRIQYRDTDGAPYIMEYLPASSLRSITVFSNDKDVDTVKAFLKRYSCYEHVMINKGVLV